MALLMMAVLQVVRRSRQRHLIREHQFSDMPSELVIEQVPHGPRTDDAALSAPTDVEELLAAGAIA